jgi:hypothetical protein
MSQGPRLNNEKVWTAQAAIAQYLIVKRGSADDTVVVASAGGDAHLGAIQNASSASGDQVRTPGMTDIGLVKTGGAVTQGAHLTSDANGKAITASGANSIIGKAMATASGADQVIPYEVCYGTA